MQEKGNETYEGFMKFAIGIFYFLKNTIVSEKGNKKSDFLFFIKEERLQKRIKNM